MNTLKNAAPNVYGRPFTSMEEALRQHRIPLENWEVIRKALAALDIVGYYGTTSYIKAVRRDGGPAIQIAYGWSSGFSREELDGALGGVVGMWESGRGRGLWGMTHPEHKGGGSGSRKPRTEWQDRGTCPACFTARSANGACACE